MFMGQLKCKTVNLKEAIYYKKDLQKSEQK